MSDVWGLIQARMGSTRLPGKVILDLAGKPLIWHVVERLRRVPGLAGIVIASTADPQNDALADFAAREGLPIHRHPLEDDIAGRLSGVVRELDATAILKVNGDCPLVDPEVLARLLDRYLSEPGLDYVSNKSIKTYPMGLSAEVIAAHPLLWCDENLSAATDREYVADWIRNHTDRFAVASIENERDLSEHGWMVDTPEDLAFVQGIFARLYRDGEVFGMEKVLTILSDAAGTPGMAGAVRTGS